MKKASILFIFVLIANIIQGQDISKEFYETSLSINNTGMYTLGSWAILNIAVGSIGWVKAEEETKYFHQMNVFWNTVNLSIAGIALYSNYTQDYSTATYSELLQKSNKTQNIYLINAGLDILYMGTGAFLMQLSNKKEKYQYQLSGYGKSIILQGAFLFVFDLVMYFVLENHRNGYN